MASNLTVNDTPVAVRSWGGKDRGTLVTMLVTKDTWEQLKTGIAQVDSGSYDIATAESVVRDWLSQGATIVWKTAADFNKDARDMDNHRFRNDPELANNFDAAIDSSRQDAKDTMRSSLKPVK